MLHSALRVMPYDVHVHGTTGLALREVTVDGEPMPRVKRIVAGGGPGKRAPSKHLVSDFAVCLGLQVVSGVYPRRQLVRIEWPECVRMPIGNRSCEPIQILDGIATDDVGTPREDDTTRYNASLAVRSASKLDDLDLHGHRQVVDLVHVGGARGISENPVESRHEPDFPVGPVDPIPRSVVWNRLIVGAASVESCGEAVGRRCFLIGATGPDHGPSIPQLLCHQGVAYAINQTFR